MTHPYLVPGSLPTGIRGVGLRLTAARFFGDRKSGSMEERFKSVIVVHTCRAMPTRPPERHPRKSRPIRQIQPRSITCKVITK